MSTLRHYRLNGLGPRSFKLGRRVMYALEDVEAWIEAARNAEPIPQRQYTESEVATAVYRHFTRPSREQIARELARQRGTHDLEMFDRGLDLPVRRLCLENADAILALFENGDSHE